MSKINCLRTGCKDVFNAFLVSDAEYSGYLEIPVIRGGEYQPKKLIEFSKAVSSKEYDFWVHFYEDDASFERIWRNPQRYLPVLMKYEGVICPDFSLYRDMPLAMQHWNIYRSHAIGNWLQSNGINVIANVRFGDERTYEVSCYGVQQHGTIAIGTHGCLKNKDDRRFLREGIDWIIRRLMPNIIIVYGKAPADIFDVYKQQGIHIIQFESSFAKSREGDYNGHR